MGRAAPALEVSAEERGELERLIRTHATTQQIAPRARMILLSAEGLKVGEIAERLDVWRKTVSQWRARWRSSADSSAKARERLSDAPRSGAPVRIKPEQACAIIALACETPENSGLPFTHWSERALADEAVRRGIIDRISRALGQAHFKKKPIPSHTACATGGRQAWAGGRQA